MAPMSSGLRLSPAVSLRYRLTELAIALGPRNPLMRGFLVHKCRKHGCRLSFRRDSIELRKGNHAMLVSPEHFIYTIDLAQHFETYFSPVVPQREGEMLVVDYSRPTLHTYRSGLQFELAAWPEEEEAIDAYFRWYRPKSRDLVFDLGAHCGVSTYAFAKLVGESGRVVAFEPDPLNFSLLLNNLQRHKLTNVIPVRAAIAPTRGQALFHREGTIGSRLSDVSTRGAVRGSELIDSITLSDAFERWGVPAFCKVDIEGSEVDVIRQSSELLKRFPTNLALDTSHWINGDTTSSRIEQLLKESGFEVESDEVAGLMTTWARPLHPIAKELQNSAV